MGPLSFLLGGNHAIRQTIVTIAVCLCQHRYEDRLNLFAIVAESLAISTTFYDYIERSKERAACPVLVTAYVEGARAPFVKHRSVVAPNPRLYETWPQTKDQPYPHTYGSDIIASYHGAIFGGLSRFLA